MTLNTERNPESEELMALRAKVISLEKEKLALSTGLEETSMFAWNISMWCVALADKNRWMTGVDLDKNRRSGLIAEDSELKVTNNTAWAHFVSDGTKIEFDAMFHTQDGQRDFPKLIRHFPRFLKTQVT